MSSLKMTFSLASLVVLIALIAMPVMAHVADPVDVDHDPTNAADGNDHAIVESITVDKRYVNSVSDRVQVTIKFAPAAAAVEADDATPDVTAVHATIDPDPGATLAHLSLLTNLTVVDILQMTAPTKTTGAIFSAIVRVASIGTDSAADGDIIITLVADTFGVYPGRCASKDYTGHQATPA